ncbi:hypothetical protein FYK55_21875 [Roseiconus nitratireducens]|uniref:SF3 helicase domain-containing protein n=1 Tax=Roseiconus nitratireducens TaxID=2605748 RepID=A0A5M6CYH5_9BACT|nr:phage/plasmid primase, P4 family [Roseiconus nitratireducens]KAA5540278.1 hypothetical protein FYK55_21875 [Roseiconus nitratireducens]
MSTATDLIVPDELRERKQWCTWYINQDGNKVPTTPSGMTFRSNDPATFATFTEATSKGAHVGFVITPDDPYTGIDLDNCLDAKGELREWAVPIVTRLDGVGFAEVSPSKRGIKFVVRGAKPEGARCTKKFGGNKQQMEVYDFNRFWTITGDTYAGNATIAENGQHAVDWICSEFLMPEVEKPPERKQRPKSAPDTTTPILEILQAYASGADAPAKGDRNNSAFRLAGNLFALRDESGAGPSHDDVLDVVNQWNDSLPDPLPEREIAQVVRSAATNGTPRPEKHRKPSGRKRQPKADGDTKPECYSWIEDDEQRNDSELATLFVNRFEDRFRYVPQWGKFIVWDGKRFKVDPDQSYVLNIVREFARSLWDDLAAFVKERHPDEKDIKAGYSEIRRINNVRGLEAVLKCARSDSRVVVDVADINADPFLINLQNGTFELLTGRFREHRQSDLITQIASVDYDENATCPEWKKTIGLVTGGDEDLAIYLQQLFGYSMTGDTGEAILPIAYGDGCNGKSTIWNALVELLGDYATVAGESLLLGRSSEHASNIASLYGQRLVVIAEPDQEQPLREARMKELTGEKFITARRMREDWWTFQRTHTFFVACNHLPKIRGTDQGVWRRIKQIPFTQDLSKVEGLTIRKAFNEWLVANEGPGILNWMIDGLALYLGAGRKFLQAKAVTDATIQYQQSEDPLQEFIDECCEIGPGLEVTARRLHQHYKDNGGTMTSTMFGREMSRHHSKSKASNGPNRGRWVYAGISIRS